MIRQLNIMPSLRHIVSEKASYRNINVSHGSTRGNRISKKYTIGDLLQRLGLCNYQGWLGKLENHKAGLQEGSYLQLSGTN